MTRRTQHLPDDLYDYLLAESLHEPDVMRRLREETAELVNANMQIAPEQAQFLALLVELIGAEKTIEIGTFTGYSTLAVALSLPPKGRIVACDISAAWTSIGYRFWQEAGVAEKIDLRLAPALETLTDLLEEGEDDFDFAFIDADKAGYLDYWERCLELVREGGLIVVDNTLWEGKVVDTSVRDTDTEAIRKFNRYVKHDPRVTLSLLPVGDGMTLARVR